MKTMLAAALSLLVLACSSTSPAPTIDKSPETAQKRVDFARLVESGIFREITVSSGNVPSVYVDPAFLAADFKDKQNMIGAVYAQYYDGSKASDFVRVVDPLTNNTLGTYSLAAGLQMH